MRRQEFMEHVSRLVFTLPPDKYDEFREAAIAYANENDLERDRLRAELVRERAKA